MNDPTSRNFWAAKNFGNQGERQVAHYLAENAERIGSILGEPLVKVLVKTAARGGQAAWSETINGIDVVHQPTHKAEQVKGDLILYGPSNRPRYVEVKSEQYGLQRLEAKTASRETSNVAVETHDIIPPLTYESLWAQGRRDGNQLLAYPSRSIRYAKPQAPEWYGKAGGHMKSEAEWFIHFFVGSGHVVLLSLRNIKQDLNAGKYDDNFWFASCTLHKGGGGQCRKPGGGGVSYYTVGKLLSVEKLERNRRAIVLSPSLGK